MIVRPTALDKWKNSLDVPEEDWARIFWIPFHTFWEATFSNFQYRVVRRILGRNQYLCKIKVTDSAIFCHIHEESIEYLFW